MKLPGVLKLCVLLMMVITSAQAQITSGYGAVADVGFFDSCATICLRPGGLDNQVVNGQEFSANAIASLSSGSDENGFASVSFTGDVFSPLLRSRSQSPAGDNNAVDGIATAIQGYTYTGASAQDYAIRISLSGTITEPAGKSEGAIEGRAAVYQYPNATFISTDYSSFVFEVVPSEGQLLAQEQVFLLTALDLRDATLEFSANPGDEFFVIMQLETKSERGAVVNATNTFSMSFSEGNVSMLNATITDSVDPDQVFTDGFE